MKYTLIDGEIHRHDNEANAYLPLSLAEAQHVVDVMNVLTLSEKQLYDGLAILVPTPTGMIERAEAMLDTEGTPV